MTIHKLAEITRYMIEKNCRDGIAWHYGLPPADQYLDVHPDYRRSYTRALNIGYSAMLRWLAKIEA
jgi:hypothetical protein